MAIETETQKAAGRPKRKAEQAQEANGAPLLASQEFVEGGAVRIKMGDDTRASLDLLSAYINKGKKAAEPGFTIARLIEFYASKDARFAEYLDTNLQSAMSALVKSPKNADKGNKVDTHHASTTRAA